MANSDNNRRKFFATTLQSVGLTALGGLLWSGYSDEVKACVKTVIVTKTKRQEKQDLEHSKWQKAVIIV